MSKYILDTDVIIEWLRNNNEVVEKIKELVKAGGYLKSYNKSHGLEIADALIAGSAHHYKMKLWTFNKKHYPMGDIKFI